MSDQHLSNNSWGELLPSHKKVAAGDGIEWLKKAWSIFTKDFVIWLVAIVAWLAAAFFISLVPFLGAAVVFLTTPVLFAGFYYAANQAHQGQKVEFEDFLYGFKNKLQPLLILGAVQFVFYFVVSVNFEAIGFLLAAKSIFRFGDLKEAKDRKLTEYVLIGTLLSFGIALLTGILVKYGVLQSF